MMKFNQRRMQEAMRRLGVQQQDIEAEEVIIKGKDRDIIITKPQVVKVNLMGQDTFQIVGNVEEKEKGYEPSEEDINLIVEKTNIERDKAIEILKRNNGDIAQSILEISEKK